MESRSRSEKRESKCCNKNLLRSWLPPLLKVLGDSMSIEQEEADEGGFEGKKVCPYEGTTYKSCIPLSRPE